MMIERSLYNIITIEKLKNLQVIIPAHHQGSHKYEKPPYAEYIEANRTTIIIPNKNIRTEKLSSKSNIQNMFCKVQRFLI